MPLATQHYHFALLAPAGHTAIGGLTELLETLAFGLQALGHSTSAELNSFHPQAINIVMGAHLLPAGFDPLPPGSIIYNAEQIFPGCPSLQGGLPELVEQYETWDYSLRNLQTWASLGCSHVRHLPTGYAPQLSRIVPAKVQDIDVFFYGSINERRRDVLAALIERNLKVEIAGNAYGAQRDALIARSKLVLNLHFYPAHIFETARVSYLLANSKAVVAEVNPDTDIDPRYAAAVEARPYERLVEGCLSLLADFQARARREQAALQIMRSMPVEHFLEPLVRSPSPPLRAACVEANPDLFSSL